MNPDDLIFPEREEPGIRRRQERGELSPLGGWGLEARGGLNRPPYPVSRPHGPLRPEFQETIQIRNPRQAAAKLGRFEIYQKGQTLVVAPGSVTYVQVALRDYEDPPAAVITTPLIPTLGGTALDAATPPSFSLVGRSDGTVWVICQQTLCSGLYATDATEPERVELTDRGAEPTTEDGEHAIRYFDFDVVDGIVTNTKTYHQGDWEQWFDCDGEFGDSDDSFWGSGVDSEGSNAPDDPPSSASSDEVPDDDCTVGMRARWINRVTCFEADPNFTGEFGCNPKQYTFIFEVEFYGTDPYDKPCPHWAYGVSMPGATTGEQVWLDQRRKTIQFTWDSAPACEYPVLLWRARGYSRPEDEEGDPSCCGRLWSGQVPEFPVRLGPVCDCTCSSSLDLDSTP